MKQVYILLLMAFAVVANGFSQETATTGIITGRVRTADGGVAPGVTVHLVGTNRKSVSDRDGEFKFQRLDPDEYTIAVSSIGLTAVERSITVMAGATVEADFVLNETAQVLEEVTVDALRDQFMAKSSSYVGKMPLGRLENTQSYSTVSRALLDQQVALSMEDGLKNVPGIMKIWDATGRAGDGGSYFASRGFITGAGLRNGMAGNMTNTVDAYNLDQIEMIKGPSATLFGNQFTSYGGVMNRVTKKPYETFGGEVGYTTGSYGMNRLTADVNVPLAADGSVLFRLNTAYQQERSFQDYGFAKGLAISPSLTLHATDKLSFQIDGEFYNSKQAGTKQVIYALPPSQVNAALTAVLGGLELPPGFLDQLVASLPKTIKEAYGADRADQIGLDYKRSYIGNDIIGTTSVANFIAQMDYRFNEQWTSTTVVASSNNSSGGDTPYFYILPNYLGNLVTSLTSGNPPTIGDPGHDYMMRMSWRPVGRDNVLQAQQNFVGDFRLGDMRNRLVVGLDWFNRVVDNNYSRFNGLLFGAIPYPGVFDVVKTSGEVPNYQHLIKGKLDSAYAAGDAIFYTSYNKLNTYSAYVSDVLNVTDQLLVSAGLRVDHFSNRGNYDPLTGTYNGGFEQTALSPKFGLIYQPIKDKLALFGNYQSGFVNQTGADVNGNVFKPEQAFQWEAGLKSDLFDSRLVATVSYYDIKVRNIVRPDPDDPNFNIQRGNQLSRGIEADITAQPVDGLSLVVGYAYNDSKMEDAGEDVEGLRPGSAGAEQMANWWVSYHLPETAIRGLGVGVGGNYVGEVLTFNSHQDGRFLLPAYTLWNASLFFERSKYRFAARMNNLTNEKYWVGWTTMNPQMPRQFLLSLAYTF
ncbi:TonB-dependent receptor domain-containing protein [Parapedobacter sp. DT-150]|uniref:TonB-dependent receptor domain-containing protein n=1 Tax=Parapedobacter sp. DT-150 TaxID=3396162 RepID=UPI003F1C908B